MTTGMNGGEATAWMRDATCSFRFRPDLPWTADAGQVRTWDRVTMTVLCDRCPVHTACSSYADAVQAEGGFWAGAHRDTNTHPDSAAIAAGAPPWTKQALPGLEPLGGAA